MILEACELSLPDSTIQLIGELTDSVFRFIILTVVYIESSPDILHVGTDGMMKFQITPVCLEGNSKKSLDPNNLTPLQTLQVRPFSPVAFLLF